MTIFHQAPTGHIVAYAPPLWGHIKPLCALLAKAVRIRPVYGTLFTSVSILEKILDEIARQFDAKDEAHLKNLIRVVGLPPPPAPFQFELLSSAFTQGYSLLYAEKSIPVAPDSADTYDAIPAPQAVIIDFFCYESLKGVRSVSGTRVPVYSWQSAAAVSALYLFGPESMGGNGDLAEKISRIEVEDPELRYKEIENLYRRIRGDLVRLPGIPPMYDYEHVAQDPFFPMKLAEIVLLLQYSYRFLEECDGVIQSTSVLYEKEAVDKWHEWFSPRPVFTVGPISPPATVEDIERERMKSPTGAEVETFLNDALDKFGPNSVIYISFGTNFWPAAPETIWTFLDVLIGQGIPFLFSHASPFAVVPDNVLAKIKSSGLGYNTKWSPQQLILRHKACGWFVSHCGHNSVLESLTAGVPLICWPFEADQPTNAANIAFVHGAGYELFEVRSGHGLRPIHRLGNKSPEGTLESIRQEARDLLTKARGEDGQAKRRKAQWFSEQFAKSWEEGGVAWNDMKKFVESLH